MYTPLCTAGPSNYSDAWYDMRDYDPNRSPAFVIGASDASVVLGLSKYKTPLQLYLEIHGMADRDEENPAMEWGKRLESAVLDKYAETVEADVDLGGVMYMDRNQPFLSCTPDAFARDPNQPDMTPWLVEAKTSSNWRYSEDPDRSNDQFGPGPDEIPKEYIVQCQHQMMVTGLYTVDVPVLFDGRTFRMYTVQRNDRMIEHLRTELARFYQAVCQKERPQPDFESDTTLGLLQTMHQPNPAIEVELTQDMHAIAERHEQVQKERKALEAEKKQMEARLLDVMKDAAVATIEGSPFVIKRSQVAESVWTENDVKKATQSLGKTKRRGYQKLVISQPKRGGR